MSAINYLVIVIVGVFIFVFTSVFAFDLPLPAYMNNASMWLNIIFIFLLGALIATLLTLLEGRKDDKQIDSFVLLFSFSILGLVIGELAGFSDEPVLGAVLPAVLSLVGGLAIYIVGKRESKEGGVVIALCVLGLAGSLLIGAHSGFVLKEDRKISLKQEEEAKKAHQKVEAIIKGWD